MGFFRTFLASLLAIAVSFLVVFFLFVALIAGLASSGGSESAPFVRDNTVLKMKLSGSIPERSVDDPFQQILDPGAGSGSSMIAIMDNLTKAAADERIKGLWLDVGMLSTSWSTLFEVRQAISKFKESGKFVYASSDDLGMNEQGYYLATAADSIFMQPQSLFEFDGFYMQPYFLKDMFDKVGIEAQIGRSGTYKSFAETYTRNDMSAESREQYKAILDATTNEFMEVISAFSGISRADLDNMLNNEPSLSTVTAFERGLIQELLYPDQLEARIKSRVGIAEDEKLNVVTSSRYVRVPKKDVGISVPSGTDKIAVINASGNIMPQIISGFGDDGGMITVANFKESLDKVLNDKNVKALVVRIDSPGGSASTSDVLHHMILEATKKIPVVASMASTAASGGYYMAMGADTVVASPLTITGSIGVISMKYNVSELTTEKLGITFDEVKSHMNADWLSLTRPFTDAQAQRFQDFNSATYEVFLGVVSRNRNMSRDEVDAVAQGRVWTGVDAKANGLVDVLGGYDDAIRIASEMAGITEYSLVNYPVQKTFLERFSSRSQTIANMYLNPQSEVQRIAREILHLAGPGQGYPVARMPVEIRIF
jgi:protease IV